MFYPPWPSAVLRLLVTPFISHFCVALFLPFLSLSIPYVVSPFLMFSDALDMNEPINRCTSGFVYRYSDIEFLRGGFLSSCYTCIVPHVRCFVEWRKLSPTSAESFTHGLSPWTPSFQKCFLRVFFKWEFLPSFVIELTRFGMNLVTDVWCVGKLMKEPLVSVTVNLTFWNCNPLFELFMVFSWTM